jgi:hypothetical protein
MSCYNEMKMFAAWNAQHESFGKKVASDLDYLLHLHE